MEDTKLLSFSILGASAIGLLLFSLSNRKANKLPPHPPNNSNIHDDEEQVIQSSCCPHQQEHVYSLYIPNHFRVEKDDQCIQLMKDNSFATLLTWKGSQMHTSHIPFLIIDDEHDNESTNGNVKLRFHLARKNPHAKALEQFATEQQESNGDDGWNCMVLFKGPHFYISPKWLGSVESQRKEVPTWNFTTVHAICDSCEVVKEKYKLVNDLTEVNEQWLLDHSKNPLSELDLNKYDFTKTDEKYAEIMLKGIVCFSLNVKELKGKFKLSQNDSTEEKQSYIEGLNRQGSDLAIDTAQFMSKWCSLFN